MAAHIKGLGNHSLLWMPEAAARSVAWPHPSPQPHLQDHRGLVLLVRMTFEILNHCFRESEQLPARWSGRRVALRRLRRVGSYQLVWKSFTMLTTCTTVQPLLAECKLCPR